MTSDTFDAIGARDATELPGSPVVCDQPAGPR